MNQLILHIPHASTNIPITDGFVVSNEFLQTEILKLTDWYTDELFYSKNDITIKADFSRVFCDPERFPDDTQEIMAQFGMGAVYEKSDSGDIIRSVSKELREHILQNYYRKHHDKLNLAVENQLKNTGKALILDCHSFPNTPFNRDLHKEPNRPDFNIGTDSYHTPDKLLEISLDFFQSQGYTVGINKPYSGSLVPLTYFRKNKNIRSIMLEINRKLYLKEGTNDKSKQFSEIKALVSRYMKEIY